MRVSEIQLNLSSASTDPLDDLQLYLSELLFPELSDAASYTSVGQLVESGLPYLISTYLPQVYKDLMALKDGSAKDRAAYRSPECQAMLALLNHPVSSPPPISLLSACEGGNQTTIAVTIILLKDQNLLTSANGLLAQMQKFISDWL